MEYTFTFEKAAQGRFLDIMGRLDPGYHTIIKEISMVNPEDPRYSDLTTTVDMDPEDCLTIRMGMKNVNIRRKRSEEEEAADKALDDRHKITVRVQVPMGKPSSP